MKHYARVFKPTEVLMMLSAFSNTETIHIAAYSHLLDTIGMPEIEYTAFMKYKEMKDKFDFMQGFNVDSKFDIARTLAAFGAFTEGLQLFASFAILLNFPRFGKMKGMGQIISWSVRDESLHCDSIIRLFRTFVRENPEIWNEDLKRELYLTCATIIEHEDAFIDLAFEQGPVEGLTAREVKEYIRYIADRRLVQLGLNALFHVMNNPLPWLDEMLNAVEHANFSRIVPPNTVRPLQPERGKRRSMRHRFSWKVPKLAAEFFSKKEIIFRQRGNLGLCADCENNSWPGSR